MEVPIRRLRQIATAIQARLKQDDRLRRVYLEWQTKELGALFGAASQMDKKQAEAFDKRFDAVSITDDIPKNKTAKTAENAPGSFEKLTRGFAS